MQPSLVPFHEQLNTPPTTKGFELLQIRTPQEAKKLLVGEAWYYWSETENRFEHWNFFSTHFARTAKDLDHNSVWKFMDESNLLALGEGEETQLFNLHQHKDLPYIFVIALDEKLVYQLFQLPHPSLEFYTKIGGKEGYLDAYEKLVEPIKKEEKKEYNLMFGVLILAASLLTFVSIKSPPKNQELGVVALVGFMVIIYWMLWSGLKDKKVKMRKDAGLIPAYQNPKISL
jgi:hypothetical protein